MKKYAIEIQNKLKEGVRTWSKAKVLKQGHEDVIRRKFENIDISKDFDNRQKKYEIQSLNNKNLIKDPDFKSMNLEELENFYIDKTSEEEIEKLMDINQKVVLSGIKKEALLAEIILTELIDKHFEDEKAHPKIKDKMSLIHNNLTHNLPIQKRDLFEAFPQYFREEIGSLTDEERLLFPMRKSTYVSSEGKLISTEGLRKDNEYLAQQTYKLKLSEMILYNHFLEKRLYEKYRIFIKQAIEEWGWADDKVYFNAIKNKDEENLTFGERLIVNELNEIELIKEEIDCLEEARSLIEFENNFKVEFNFPVSDQLRKEIEDLNSYVMKYRTYNIEDTNMIPLNHKEQPDIMDVLRNDKSFDIDEIIKIDEENYKKLINSGLAIEQLPIDEKSPDLIRKVNLVSNSIKEYLKPNEPQLMYNGGAVPLDYLEEGFLGYLPAPGRIHIDEYYKTLFLNEENNKRYDFNYWVNYYDVDPTVLRNILNYVYYPVQDSVNPSEINRIIYFKDPEYEERRKMISSMNTQEYDDYMKNTKERPELEELKRLDYLKHIEMSTEPRITKRTVVYDLIEHEKIMENPLFYSDVMKAVDDQIFKVAKDIDISGKLEVDPDLRLRIEKLKDIQRLENIRNLEYDDHMKIKDSLNNKLNEKNDLLKIVNEEKNKLI